jgi:hypothetical protein
VSVSSPTLDFAFLNQRMLVHKKILEKKGFPKDKETAEIGRKTYN